MKLRTNRLTGLFAIALLALASPALADQHEKTDKAAKPAAAAGSTPAKKPEPSAESRAKMADAHQRMAECLRSNRPIHECHAEMHKFHESCEKNHGEGCTMGHHAEGEHHGMHGGGPGDHGKGHGKPATAAPSATGSAPAPTTTK